MTNSRTLWFIATLAILSGCAESGSGGAGGAAGAGGAGGTGGVGGAAGTGGVGGAGGTGGVGGAGGTAVVAVKIFLYNSGGSPADMGGRSGADAIAQDGLPDMLPGVSGGAVYKAHAFVSITGDALADFPENLDVPDALPILGIQPDGTETGLASDWADLMDGEIAVTIGQALGIQDFNYFWSGSDPLGQATGTDCEGFTVTTGNTGGISNRMNTTLAWLEETVTGSCTSGYFLLGIAYCTANCPD